MVDLSSVGISAASPYVYLSIDCAVGLDGTVAAGPGVDRDPSVVRLNGYIGRDGWLVDAILFVPGFDPVSACEAIGKATGMMVRVRPSVRLCSRRWIAVERLYLGPGVFDAGLRLHSERVAEATYQSRLHQVRAALAGIDPAGMARLARDIGGAILIAPADATLSAPRVWTRPA